MLRLLKAVGRFIKNLFSCDDTSQELERVNTHNNDVIARLAASVEEAKKASNSTATMMRRDQRRANFRQKYGDVMYGSVGSTSAPAQPSNSAGHRLGGDNSRDASSPRQKAAAAAEARKAAAAREASATSPAPASPTFGRS